MGFNITVKLTDLFVYAVGIISGLSQILTHLITKYAELEDEDVQEIDRETKEPISGETLFEEFV